MAQERETERDRLTGLSTRKEFEERFTSAVAEAHASEAALSVASLDIDHFKQVNDAKGHAVGDAVIRSVADAVRGVVGTAGLAARYGGEEFVLLLPGMEREQAFLLVERLRAIMDVERDYAAGGVSGTLRVTVSGGVAAYPTDGRTTSEILRKADQALYRAKDTGRNRICIAQEERMAAKTSHYTLTQLDRLAQLAREEGLGEAVLLREALDDLLVKYRVSDIES